MKTSECEFCQQKFSDTVIEEYRHWELQLFTDQNYLGRSLIKLKRHAVDLTDLRPEERKEFFEKVLPELEDVLDEVFGPDLYNQATLGNDCRHFHFHVIPRYSSERNFAGERFVDENWNSHYKDTAENDTSKEVFNSIKNRLKQEIQK